MKRTLFLFTAALLIVTIGFIGAMFFFESKGNIWTAEVCGYLASIAGCAALYTMGLFQATAGGW